MHNLAVHDRHRVVAVESESARDLVEAHAAAFPREADGLRRLLELTAQVTRESQQLPPHLSFRELDQALEHTFPASDPIAVDSAAVHEKRHRKREHDKE